MNIIDLLNLSPDHPARQDVDARATLKHRITVLNTRSWENKIKWGDVEEWLENFTGAAGYDPQSEQLSALYLLSQFMYYGSREVRVLLKSVYQEKVLVPLIQRVRTALGGTRDVNSVKQDLDAAVAKVRVLGIGNPSESGTHLLYYVRQENSLDKATFINPAEILKTQVNKDASIVQSLANPDITDYYFIDDVCGSGETVIKFYNAFLQAVASISHKTNPNIKFHYYCLFGTRDGMNNIRSIPLFSETAAAIYELDDTYQSLGDTSRYFRNTIDGIDSTIVKAVAGYYGHLLWPDHPGGFGGNQLLLGFHHNTPDNSLPIFWGSAEHRFSSHVWRPIFRRHMKYGY